MHLNQCVIIILALNDQYSCFFFFVRLQNMMQLYWTEKTDFLIFHRLGKVSWKYTCSRLPRCAGAVSGCTALLCSDSVFHWGSNKQRLIFIPCSRGFEQKHFRGISGLSQTGSKTLSRLWLKMSKLSFPSGTWRRTISKSINTAGLDTRLPNKLQDNDKD